MHRDPFFIIGAPRSGTTMLQMALNRHTQIAIPPETAYFAFLKRSRRGQLRNWICIEKDLQVQIDPPTERLRPGPIAREYFCRIANAFLRRLGKPSPTYFGEKSPQHQRFVPEILQTFPEAKFVLIYRDGRDVALSMTNMPAMPNNLYVNFAVWLHFYHIQRRLLQQEPQRIFRVRYEDLVKHPEGNLRRILEFLDLEYEPSVAEGSGNREGVPDYELSYKGRALQPISTDRIGKWKETLSKDQIVRLERWGGWALQELQYDCIKDARAFLPPWHKPLVYGRLAMEVTRRTLQRKADEYFNTSFHRSNRIAQSLPTPDLYSNSSQKDPMTAFRRRVRAKS